MGTIDIECVNTPAPNFSKDRIEAHHLVEEAFRQHKVQFTERPAEFRYDIPNFSHFYEKVVDFVNDALAQTKFYAQEMPYREMIPESIPEYLLILHRDNSK